MTPLTVEAMLQIGYGRGLNTVEESYTNIMNHYDYFFPIENFAEHRKAFDKLIIDAGLTEYFQDDTGSGRRFINMPIKEAAERLGYVLKEIDYDTNGASENNTKILPDDADF